MADPGRRIVSVAADNHRVFAVCDDGTLWMQGAAGGWSQVLAPPLELVPPGEEIIPEGADATADKRKVQHGR